MGEKSLGQIAFEAYRVSTGGRTFDDKPIPDWDELSGDGDRTRAAWEAAANAVVNEAGDRYIEGISG